MSLNLARQPFVNSRPVRRLVLVLWLVSAVLLVANLFLYTRHFSGQEERRGRLAALDELERSERQRLAELESELAAADLEWQNRQVTFLNRRIAERVFPWSRLFDRLTEALPRQVRLTRLRPHFGREERLAAVAGGEETVELELAAEAQTEEAILELVNALFEHPAFRSPNLESEMRRGGSSVTEFALTVTYLPERAAVAAAAAPVVKPPAAAKRRTGGKRRPRRRKPGAGAAVQPPAPTADRPEGRR